MENSKTLQEATELVLDSFSNYDENTPTVEWNHRIAARDLSYQIGSLTKALMQLEGERFDEQKSKQELREIVADELADILAETLYIAHEMDISMSDALDAMVESDNKKIEKQSKFAD